MTDQNRNILVVDENPKERSALSDMLEQWDYQVTTAHDGRDGAAKLDGEMFRLVIASAELPDMDGRDFLDTIHNSHGETAVLFLSHHAAIENAVDLMKAGALDFLVKPVDGSTMRRLLKKTFDETPPATAQKTSALTIVTQDPSMNRLLDLAKQVADSRASVMIQGESGTGKELFARFVHENSRRKNGPFVAVNCGALPESLLESELFGHEKGAFTGAVSQKPGKFELANGGTLLLDEITEMQIHLQSKLLRVLQEREVDRVGGRRPVTVDVRVIATTNRDLTAAIEKGEFREDLFYRLNVIPLKIPPLRERAGDIALLARHFIEKYNRIDGRRVKSLAKDAADTLGALPYYGNVRELENIMERAVLLCDGVTVKAADLFLETPAQGPRTDHGATGNGPLPEMMTGPLKEVEKKLIFHTLTQTDGNRTHAAKMLGISVRTLRNKLNEYKELTDS